MGAADRDAVCDVIGLAFADNPSTLANVRGDRARARRVMRDAVRVAKFGRASSYGLVAEEQGRIVGALNAAPWPRCQLTAGEKLRTGPAMIRIMGSSIPRAFAMMSGRAAHDPAEAHWHLGPVGVHPECQGRGVGSALLASALTMVDEEGAAAFLETDVDRNVVLYERFGFAVVDRAEIVGVDTRFLWRAGRPAPASRAPSP